MSLDVTAVPVKVATRPAEAGTPKPTVRVKTCCGVLRGEACACAEQAATARALFLPGRAIMCRPASEWGTR